jgi:glycosyltransferase involved in cell wall biosynthesis
MRIAMVGTRGIPAGSGGAERVVQELAAELTARGHEVLVYSRCGYVGRSPHPPAGRSILTPGLPGKHLDTITHTATAMCDLLRRKVDVVHVHSPGPALLSWIPRLAGLPVVLTIHAPDWQRDRWSAPAQAALRLGLSCGMRLAAAVTCVSPSLAGQLSKQFAREVHWVPNGVRPASPPPIRRISRWGLEDDRYVLTVGRIVPEKGLDLLLRAWPVVAGKFPHKLVIVGGPGDAGYARRCRDIAPEAAFVGEQTGGVLSELYGHASLIVQPSRLEGMSLVLLEAAVLGRCILAADIEANSSVMGDSILYFNRDNADDLANRVCQALGDQEDRREAGRRAKALVESRYTWSAAAALMECVYRQAIRGVSPT